MVVLKNCTLVHLHPAEVRAGVEVVVEGTRVASVGSAGASRPTAGARVIDLGGKILMPGLVCGHTHFYSALSRGLTARVEPSTDFVSHLQHLWWKLDRAIDSGILRASALVGAIEAVRAGCTSVIDHHASPSFITGSLDVLAECLELVGLRAVLCYETTDRNGGAGMEEGIAENARFARKVEAEKSTRGEARLVEAMIGGHAPFTISDPGLRSLSDLCAGTGRGFHVHVAEDTFDPSFSHAVHGKDVMARLDSFGLLDRPALIGHGLYLDAADRALLNARGCFLAHNCRSNMNNAVGYNHALPGIENAVLGTDGIGSDMFEETRTAFFKHRDAGGAWWPPDFVRLLQNGNSVVSRCFGRAFGRVAEGAPADLVVLDYVPPTPLLAANVAGHFVFGMSSSTVQTVIVNGALVMEDRRFPWDTGPALDDARTQAARLWQRMDELR